MFALAVPGLDPNRPVALQLFPFRELLILAIYASHMEPFYTHLWKNLGTTKALSPREGEVYKLLQQGLSNADIALELHISLATVKSHVRQVLRKQGVESRADLTEEQKS